MLDKSLTALRSIAQSMGIKFSFGQSAPQLQEAIDIKIAEGIPEPQPVTTEHEPTDGQYNLEFELQPFIKRGLRLSFHDADSWQMDTGARRDSGRMDMPIRSIEMCAEALFR